MLIWRGKRMNIVNVTLNTGEIISIDSHTTGRDLISGDVYVAKRNTGWELLTCDYVDNKLGYVAPKEVAYYYDLNECHKVVN